MLFRGGNGGVPLHSPPFQDCYVSEQWTRNEKCCRTLRIRRVLSRLGKMAKLLSIFLFLFFSFLIGLTTTRWSVGKYHMTLSQCHNGVTDGHVTDHSHSLSHD